MICRPSHQGRRLDVAGLNEITVLVDRSETQLTEVGLNTWRKGLEGPPHSHDAKEQIFYVTAGEGVVVVGHARYAVKPGSLVYVPPLVVHQTIVTGETPLTYLLFNAFLDASKEGHASFAEHIEKVKHLRQQQARSGRAQVTDSDPCPVADRPGRHIPDVGFAAGQAVTAPLLLLSRAETSRSEVTQVGWVGPTPAVAMARPDRELTLFVLERQGRVTVGGERVSIGRGDVVFVPCGAACRVESDARGLRALCFATLLGEVPGVDCVRGA